MYVIFFVAKVTGQNTPFQNANKSFDCLAYLDLTLCRILLKLLHNTPLSLLPFSSVFADV